MNIEKFFKNTKLLIPVIVVLLVIFAALLFVLKGQHNDTPKPQETQAVTQGTTEETKATQSDVKDTSPTLIVPSITTAAGDANKEVVVAIENNPGLIGLHMVLEYDDTVLTVTKVGTEAAFEELNYQKPAKYKSGCNLIFYSAEVEDVFDEDAFYLQFDIADDTPAGTYPIELIVVDAYSNGRTPEIVKVICGSIVVE